MCWPWIQIIYLKWFILSSKLILNQSALLFPASKFCVFFCRIKHVCFSGSAAFSWTRTSDVLVTNKEVTISLLCCPILKSFPRLLYTLTNVIKTWAVLVFSWCLFRHRTMEEEGPIIHSTLRTFIHLSVFSLACILLQSRIYSHVCFSIPNPLF